ncbi:sodium:solute symporter family transporter [Rhodococcus opacus]|uniref:sodium:solute symporter family transporter n=1 Tax=Rhodococcus opacus TaxID=37919 RepID=UPI0002D6AE35|nr:hypothetical protein [Rhodococcus opacus]AHK32636.1 hypothetical protein Pd630_LPD05433 [Rhodococcus opacus PD630]
MAILDWILLGAYFLLLVLIGVQTMRRVKSPDDFAVAGNRIIWPVFFGSLAAAFLGGGASLGVAGAAMRDGYVYMFAFCAFGVQTVLVGYFVAPRLKNYIGAHTLGDIMEAHYGRPARLVTAYCPSSCAPASSAPRPWPSAPSSTPPSTCPPCPR